MYVVLLLQKYTFLKTNKQVCSLRRGGESIEDSIFLPSWSCKHHCTVCINHVQWSDDSSRTLFESKGEEVSGQSVKWDNIMAFVRWIKCKPCKVHVWMGFSGAPSCTLTNAGAQSVALTKWPRGLGKEVENEHTQLMVARGELLYAQLLPSVLSEGRHPSARTGLGKRIASELLNCTF
jgi:hypothetical protein